MKLTGLTETQIAQLAAGVPLNAGAAESVEAKAAREAAELAAVEAARIEAEAATAAAALLAAAETPEAKTAREAAEAQATADAAALAATAKETEIVAFLKGEIASKDALILAATIKTTALEAQVAANETTHAPLVEIARSAVANMRVALGGSAGDVATMSDIAVVAEHKSLSATFKDKFKVGGVSAVDAETATGKQSAADTNHLARVSAAKGK